MFLRKLEVFCYTKPEASKLTVALKEFAASLGIRDQGLAFLARMKLAKPGNLLPCLV